MTADPDAKRSSAETSGQGVGGGEGAEGEERKAEPLGVGGRGNAQTQGSGMIARPNDLYRAKAPIALYHQLCRKHEIGAGFLLVDWSITRGLVPVAHGSAGIWLDNAHTFSDRKSVV